jgi:hypothetical protein
MYDPVFQYESMRRRVAPGQFELVEGGSLKTVQSVLLEVIA